MKVRTLQNRKEEFVDENGCVVRVERLREDEESRSDSDGDLAGGREEEKRGESIVLNGEEGTIYIYSLCQLVIIVI